MSVWAIRLAAAIVAFGAGWSVNGWRIDAERLQEVETARESLRLMTVSRDALAADLRASSDIQAFKLREAQDETNRMRDRVAAGDQRLRVAVRCPAVPSASAAPGVGAGISAELDAAAQSAYFALRDGITRVEGQLAACQGQLNLRAR